MRNPQESHARVMAWLKAPMTQRDFARIIAFMRATEERSKHSQAPNALSVLTSVRRSSRRIAFVGASALFTAAVAVLAGAAVFRSRTILLLRASRARLSSFGIAINWKAVRRPAFRLAESALWIVAAATLGYCSYAYASAALHQDHQKALFSELRSTQAVQPNQAQAGVLGASARVEPPVRGAMLGILDIPRIGLSTVVEQGDDSHTLRESIGHIPSTSLPGQEGNAGLAAHRDTYFRHLSEVKPGDQLMFQSLSGTYLYTVRSTSIVAPDDMAVLAPTQKPTLTLVTCFPFYYVGNAPKRFVLVATENAPAP